MTGRVLVVDDELPNRLVMRKILAGRGCDVVEAADGPTACRVAKQEAPDLVLVDVMMPGMDGYEVCRRLKESETTRDIAVVMVTARTEIDDIERGFDVGATDYIRKPFNPRELIARVRNALELKRSTDALRAWNERVSRELELAGMLQRTLLDIDPLLTRELDIRATCRPTMNVGGDILDVQHLYDGRVCFYVGDICGHGVAPAIVASMLKGTLSELMAHYGAAGPTVICNELDLRFRHHIANPALYATLFLGIYNTATRRLEAFCCGHPPPILLNANGTATTDVFKSGGGVPIGFSLAEPASYREDDAIGMTIPGGGNLLVYTDGLTEATMGADGWQCGISRLAEVFGDATGQTESVSVSDALFTGLERAGYNLAQDDCSALVLHVIDPRTVLLDEKISGLSDDLHRLATDIEQRLLAAGWSETAAGAVQLLVLEHGANAIDHGNLPDGAAISVQLRNEGERCALLFSDPGQKWNVKAGYASTVPESELAERGRGLMIIETIADSIEIYRRDDRNVTLYTIRRDIELEDMRQPDAV